MTVYYWLIRQMPVISLGPLNVATGLLSHLYGLKSKTHSLSVKYLLPIASVTFLKLVELTRHFTNKIM